MPGLVDLELKLTQPLRSHHHQGKSPVRYDGNATLTYRSQLWNTFHKRENAHAIVKKQLADWGVDYFDL